MRDQIIEIIARNLTIRAEYFTREQEIQIYLANIFENSGLFDRVYLEYHIPAGIINNYPWNDANNIYVDIVLFKNGVYYPIEIKFKTQSQPIGINVFGANQQIYLGHHRAKNIGCYDFWKDVKRLELYESYSNNIEQGIMLFVSNDASYRTPPLNINTGYAQFSIHENKHVIINEVLNWNRPLTISQNRPPINLNREYLISWSNMQIPNHYFILL